MSVQRLQRQERGGPFEGGLVMLRGAFQRDQVDAPATGIFDRIEQVDA
jgi:hypothetical protein